MHQQRLMQQAKSFSGVLNQFQQKTEQEGMVQNRARTEGKEADAVETNDRVSDLDTQSEEVQEQQESGRAEELQKELRPSKPNALPSKVPPTHPKKISKIRIIMTMRSNKARRSPRRKALKAQLVHTLYHQKY